MALGRPDGQHRVGQDFQPRSSRLESRSHRKNYQPAWKARNWMCDDASLLLMMGRTLDRRQHCLILMSPVA